MTASGLRRHHKSQAPYSRTPHPSLPGLPNQTASEGSQFQCAHTAKYPRQASHPPAQDDLFASCLTFVWHFFYGAFRAVCPPFPCDQKVEGAAQSDQMAEGPHETATGSPFARQFQAEPASQSQARPLQGKGQAPKAGRISRCSQPSLSFWRTISHHGSRPPQSPCRRYCRTLRQRWSSRLAPTPPARPRRQ